MYKFPLEDLRVLHALSDLFVRHGRAPNIRFVTEIIMYSVLCNILCDILQFREGRSVKVFENRVLRRVFRPKRDEVTGMGSLEKTT